eukprot:1159174-Pelagomonas_calceolata.AAC.5
MERRFCILFRLHALFKQKQLHSLWTISWRSCGRDLHAELANISELLCHIRRWRMAAMCEA